MKTYKLFEEKKRRVCNGKWKWRRKLTKRMRECVCVWRKYEHWYHTIECMILWQYLEARKPIYSWNDTHNKQKSHYTMCSPSDLCIISKEKKTQHQHFYFNIVIDAKFLFSFSVSFFLLWQHNASMSMSARERENISVSQRTFIEHKNYIAPKWTYLGKMVVIAQWMTQCVWWKLIKNWMNGWTNERMNE